MALTPGLQLPYGIQPTNAIPVDSFSGPYTGGTINEALTAANNSIPANLRFQSLEVRLIVGGTSYKYWYRGGTSNSDLVEFASTSSGISGPYVSFFNGFTGGITLAVGTGITLTQSNGVITIDATGETTVVGATGPTGPTGPQGNTGNTGQGTGYTAIGLSGGFLWVSPVDVNGIRGASFSIGYVQGNTGNTGDPGIQGNTGNTGAPGIQGNTGNTGNTGAGYTAIGLSGGFLWVSVLDSFGIRGASFSIGYVQGNTGNTGNTGDPGIRGNTGNTGNTGDPGIRGNTGNTGNTGDPGIRGNTGNTGNTGIEGPGYTAIGLSGSELWISPVVAGVRGASYSLGIVRGNTGNTGNTGDPGARGNTGATGPTDIQSTNSSGTFYPLFASGTGNTAIYIDNVTTPFTYVPSTGSLTGRSFIATNGTNTTTISVANITVDNGTDNVTFSESAFSHSGTIPFALSSNNRLRLSGSTIEFYGSGYGYTFPSVNGTSGQALLTRGNGGLYWGTVSTSGGGGGGGTTLFAGTGITLAVSGAGTTVSTILGMTATSIGFEISGGVSQAFLGVCGGAVTIVGTAGSNLEFEFPSVSTTLVGVHNTVSGISGSTGNIGLVAGSNVTITQSGRTFTIASSGSGGLGNTGATGATGPQGATGPADIQSSNSSAIFYPLFAGGTGNTAIYIDNVTTPLRYTPSTGTLGLRTLSATAGNGNIITLDSLNGSLNIDTRVVNGNAVTLTPTGIAINSQENQTFSISSYIGSTASPIHIRSSQIGFANYSGEIVYFPNNTGTSGQALLTRGNGATLYWGDISTSGTTGATGATGAGYTAIGLSGGFLWVSPVDEFGVRGASFSIGYVQGATGATPDSYVAALNGFTGGVTLAEGTNITISSANNIITISSSGGGSPSGNYVNTYDGRTGDVFTPPLVLYALGII